MNNKIIVVYEIKNKKVLHASSNLLEVKAAMKKQGFEVANCSTIGELAKVANANGFDVATTSIEI